ncbi:mediator of RNA polymerase II transcription subunit 13-like [Microplitis mediator]|uniref:mediator of RNA polymerase II transcription subunit 13-like n=1 Tax=Microplitis mediator TaxID=375433 RepID=UPI0025523137|nr:mediator of RNA polymerase II transcription subunit 13-like [Microplitis mediator]
MPAASSIYWNSIDSQRSSSSGDAGSARQYVDPWDLENYAYLRRHSIAAPGNHQKHHHHHHHHHQVPQTSYSRVSQRREPENEYWYAKELSREPGYLPPASVEEIYFGPSTKINNSHYQPIYEDDPRYAAPVYAPLTDLEQAKQFEDRRLKEVLRRRKLSRTSIHGREEYIYHSASNRRDSVDNNKSKSTSGGEENCYFEVIQPSNIGFSNYGHLKIDYTNSWNSLQRKITK